MTDDVLFAAHNGTLLMAAASVELATAADEDDRVVSGLVLPYGPVGHASIGDTPVRIRVPDASRVRIPEDISRIKLMDYHQRPAVAIGHCTAIRDTPEGKRASFRVARTPAGDAALVELREHVRDGLSVELGDIETTPGVDADELVAGYMLGVSLVPIPAWDTARHDGLAAARSEDTTTTGGTTMTPEQRARLVELLAKNGRTPEEEAEFNTLVTQLATSPTPEDQAAAADAAQPEAQLAAAHAGSVATVPATVPSSSAATGTPTRRGMRSAGERDLRELFAAQARVLSGHSRPELEAALSDITATANIWVGGTEYDGQLWQGVSYQRKYVPLMVSKPLTNYKGTGWRWLVKPEVADYAGDKADVPSNAPTTEDADWSASRLAGAHDIDRKHWDFGDTEFIASYYEAMGESYAKKSDGKALAAILATAAANAAVVGGGDLFGAAAYAAQAVEDATEGVGADYFLVNSADRLALIELAAGDMPAFLELFGVTPDKFKAAPGVASGTVIAGSKTALRWRELGETPIRVETISLSDGGIDGGVFGYWAVQELHGGGVQRATFTP